MILNFRRSKQVLSKAFYKIEQHRTDSENIKSNLIGRTKESEPSPDITPFPSVSLDESGMMMFTGGASGGYGITPNENTSFNFLLGVLNSKLTEWYIRKTSTQMRGGWYSYESRFIKSVPFPSILSHSPLEEAVQNQIDRKGENKKLSNQISELVYELYGLTEAEIKIVEGRNV